MSASGSISVVVCLADLGSGDEQEVFAAAAAVYQTGNALPKVAERGGSKCTRGRPIRAAFLPSDL